MNIFDVHLIVNHSINHLLIRCSNLLRDHNITYQVPHHTCSNTLQLLNNLITLYVDIPQQMDVHTEQEPLPTLKDPFSSQIQIVKKEEEQEPISPNRVTQKLMRRSTNRMKSSSLSIVMNRTVRHPSKKQSIEAVKLPEPTHEMDAEERYYREQHELKCKMLEIIAKNDKKKLEEKQLQKNQIDQMKKRQANDRCGYDFDGSILPYNKPYMKFKQYHVQSKILKKKQENPKFQKKIPLERVQIKNSSQVDFHIHQTEQEGAQILSSKVILQSKIRNFDEYTKNQKIEKLMHDSSLRMTKKQYNEASQIVISESQLLKYIPQSQEREKFEQKKITSYRDGEIKCSNHLRFLLTEPDDDREILVNDEKSNPKDTPIKHLMGLTFQNPIGKLPIIKGSKEDKKLQKSKRAITQYC